MRVQQPVPGSRHAHWFTERTGGGVILVDIRRTASGLLGRMKTLDHGIHLFLVPD